MSNTSFGRSPLLFLSLIPLVVVGCDRADTKSAPAPTAELTSPATTESPDRKKEAFLETDKEDMDGNN